MPLESGDYISDLVETNPPGADQVSQGDDHLRLLKHVLLTTFPSADEVIDKVEQAEAEDPTNTTQYIWTPQRVEQAIQAALALWTPPAVPGGASTSCFKNATQTITATPSKVLFQDTNWDDGGWYANNGDITPGETGVFQVFGRLNLDPPGQNGEIVMQIRVDNTTIWEHEERLTGDGKTTSVGIAALVDLPAGTETVTIWAASQNLTSATVRADVQKCYYQVYKVSDQGSATGGLA